MAAITEKAPGRWTRRLSLRSAETDYLLLNGMPTETWKPTLSAPETFGYM